MTRVYFIGLLFDLFCHLLACFISLYFLSRANIAKYMSFLIPSDDRLTISSAILFLVVNIKDYHDSVTMSFYNLIFCISVDAPVGWVITTRIWSLKINCSLLSFAWSKEIKIKSAWSLLLLYQKVVPRLTAGWQITLKHLFISPINYQIIVVHLSCAILKALLKWV